MTRSAFVSTTLFLMMLVYNRSLMDEPTAQLLLMMCMGTVVQLCRFGNDASP